MAWTVRLSDGAPAKTWAVFGFAGLAGVAGVVLFGSPLLGLLGFAIILASTAEFWLGVRYTLDPKGVRVRCGLGLSGMEWSEVRRAWIEGDSIRLSPLERPGRTDVFRGVSVRTTAENRDQALALIGRYWGQDVGLPGE